MPCGPPPAAGPSTIVEDKDPEQPPRVFAFDYSFWSHDPADKHFVTQVEVFTKLGPDILKEVFAGYNSCVFAYGQTGSGKSYTMMGGPGEDRGLTPRLCEELFIRIGEMQSAKRAEDDKFDWSATVEVSTAVGPVRAWARLVVLRRGAVAACTPSSRLLPSPPIDPLLPAQPHTQAHTAQVKVCAEDTGGSGCAPR